LALSDDKEEGLLLQ
jgi:hypothetical protein